MGLIYKKVVKRIKKELRFIVPHNTHYKPIGEYLLRSDLLKTDQEPEAIVHNVYANHLTTLTITKHLYNACSDYWKPKKHVITDYVVIEVPKGRIHTDNENSVAIISRQNQVIDNVSLSLKDGKVTETGLNNIFSQCYFTAPTKVKGTVFSMLTGGAGINNISHWFIDVLPRLHLLKESGLYEKVDWFLVPSLQYDFQRETLAMLDIPEEKIIAGDLNPHLTADCVIASTAPRGKHTLVPTWVCEYIRSSFLPLVDDGYLKPETNMKIYISRNDSKMRHVLNEKQLIEALDPYQFKTITLSKLSIKERIKLFQETDTVISATGAGLVSILFCRPGTKVIELFNEGFVVEPYYDIATKINLDYHYIICEGERRIGNITQGQHTNLNVDIPAMMSKVKENKANPEIKHATR